MGASPRRKGGGASRRSGRWPALVYRLDHQPWRVRVPLAALTEAGGPAAAPGLDGGAIAARIRGGGAGEKCTNFTGPRARVKGGQVTNQPGKRQRGPRLRFNPGTNLVEASMDEEHGLLPGVKA